MPSGSRGEDLLSGSQGAGLCSQDLRVRAVLSGSRGAGLCSQDLRVRASCQGLGVKAVLSVSQGRASCQGLGQSGAIWGSCVCQQSGPTFSMCVG